VFLFRLLLIYNQDIILNCAFTLQKLFNLLDFLLFQFGDMFLVLMVFGSEEDQRCDQENMLPLTL